MGPRTAGLNQFSPPDNGGQPGKKIRQFLSQFFLKVHMSIYLNSRDSGRVPDNDILKFHFQYDGN